MRAAVAVILRKDLRLRLRDRSLLLFAFVVPLGLTLLFSSILPDEQELDLAALVVDADGGEVAAGFVDGVVPALAASGLLSSWDTTDEASARAEVSDREVDAAWIIPEGFSADVLGGRPTEIGVLVAAGRGLQGEVARQVAEGFAAEVEQIALAAAVTGTVSGRTPGPQDIARLAETAVGQPRVVTLDEEVTGSGERLDATSHLAAGMAAFFVFFVVMFGVTGIIEERHEGTMARLLAAPIPPAAPVLAKILGAMLLGLFSMGVLAAASTGLLGARWGPAGGVALLIVALVLAATGVLALVGSFARTAEQAGNYQSVVAVVLGLLGGVFFPIPGDAALLRVAAAISPHGWFLRGLTELRASGDWMVVWPAVLAMLAFGVVAAIPAVLRYRREAGW